MHELKADVDSQNEDSANCNKIANINAKKL